MENLIISYPVRNPKTFIPNSVLEYIADRYGYLALEITVSRSTICFAGSLVNKIRHEFEGIPLYLRFHAPLTRDYDPFLSRDGIEALTTFIRENYYGGYLIVHSMTDLPSDEDIKLAQTLVSSSKMKGVVLCLENLATGWSSNPESYQKVLAATGMKGILDVGHLYSSDVVKSNRCKVNDVVEFLLPHLTGAHVYEYESNGHHPAFDPYLIGDVLTLLRNGGVSWWTVELEDENSFLGTLKTLELLFEIV